MLTADEIIKILNLRKHPTEGGYFIETYRSKEIISSEKRGERSISTAIYFLLTPETFSETHRLPIDEIFHFYLGDPVEMLNLFEDGTGKRLILGGDIVNGMSPQVLVPAGVWQGSRLLPGGKFALMGTTVAPGFEYSDYESGRRDELIRCYPEFKEWIALLTRN
jgi:predicted cupin superfamily sugar epimerase